MTSRKESRDAYKQPARRGELIPFFFLFFWQLYRLYCSSDFAEGQREEWRVGERVEEKKGWGGERSPSVIFIALHLGNL